MIEIVFGIAVVLIVLKMGVEIWLFRLKRRLRRLGGKP